MISQHIWIVYTLNSKISRQKSLKCDICELNAMKRFVKKRNDLIQNMIILRKCAKITLISSSFCDLRINYRINLRNFKVNFSTIEIKIKHLRASETIRSIQLIMRGDQTRRSCRQIYLCVFEKITTAISEVEEIVAMITIKSSKHSIKSSVIHVTKKNTSQMIRRVSSTSNIKKNEIVAKKKWKKLEFNVRRHNIKIKIAKAEITRFDLNNCDCYVFWDAKNKVLDKFKSKKEFYIASFDQRRIITRKCRIFIEDANREWTHCYFVRHARIFNCDNR